MDYVKIATIGVAVLILFGLGGIIFKINQANGVLRASSGQVNQQLTAAKQEAEKQKTTLSKAQSDLATTQASLKEIQDNLGKKDKLYSDLNKSLDEAKSNLASTTSAWQSANDNLKIADEKITKFTSDLGQYNSSIFYSLTRLGVGATNQDLAKIPVADYNFVGYDTDGDGLSDVIERAIGTDPEVADTDGDGFGDKEEVVGGFNPKGAGSMAFDSGFTDKQKGKILLQTQSKGEAWYVSVFSGKRFFLGLPSDAVKVLQSVGL